MTDGFVAVGVVVAVVVVAGGVVVAVVLLLLLSLWLSLSLFRSTAYRKSTWMVFYGQQ